MGKEEKTCSKIDTCHKIVMVMDKDLLDIQYAVAIRSVCAKCKEFELNASPVGGKG